MEHFFENIKTIDGSVFDYQHNYAQAVKDCPDGGTMVEVGSWMGQSIAFLAVEATNSGKGIHIVSVDSFLGDLYNTYREQENHQWETFKNNLLPVWKDLTVIKSLSDVASRYFKDINYVFIDADHSYDAVCKDIDAWWVTVISGGRFAGHDYKHPPVRQAVDEFSARVGISYFSDGNYWEFIKP
jgi:cephalosporin hydroxylase